jgi:tRNA dimethylallyltransferase
MPLRKIPRSKIKNLRPRKKIIFLLGPTAVGKSQIAVSLAKRINAEIISCDSMQIYKGMGILTSQPSAHLKAKVAHHLLGTVPVSCQYDAWQYRKAALKKISQIIAKGKIPLFVGGSGLYAAALIDGIFKAKSEDRKIRNKLYRLAKLRGGACLYQQLSEVDPGAASKIHPNDIRRVVRALEVFRTTGKPISWLQKEKRGLSADYDLVIFGLDMEREGLYRRIDRRTEKMFQDGLVAQVKSLLKKKLSRTASYAIGIRELKGYFDGLYDLEQAKRLIQRNSRNYAKRQLTWFRREKRIRWIKVGANQKPQEIADRIRGY